jgi:hypothetical protein
LSRNTLHELVDRLPDDGVPAAERVLAYLTAQPAFRAAWAAPADDEPVTEADEAAIVRARQQIQAGKTIPHDDILREFGLK